MTLDRAELEKSPLSDLHAIASELGIEGYRRLRRGELIDSILADGSVEATPERQPRRARGAQSRARSRRAAASEPDGEEDDGEAPIGRSEEDEETRSGVLDVLPNGSGFMRPNPFTHSSDDVYVSPAQIRRCELRSGDRLEGPVRSARRSERHPSLVRVERVNGAEAEPPSERPRFDELTPRFASRRVASAPALERAPFGRGSRVAITGPPGAGTTSTLRQIALALADERDIELIVVLAGVRPEEVPEWQAEQSLNVVGGGFDRSVDEQAQAAELAVELAKRAVENGRDAALVVDSLDALPPAVGRRVFAAARDTEEAGSLTVVASTGSAGEPLRLATTRILLEPTGGDGGGPALGSASGTLRADRLK